MTKKPKRNDLDDELTAAFDNGIEIRRVDARSRVKSALLARKPTVVHDCDDELYTARLCERFWPGRAHNENQGGYRTRTGAVGEGERRVMTNRLCQGVQLPVQLPCNSVQLPCGYPPRLYIGELHARTRAAHSPLARASCNIRPNTLPPSAPGVPACSPVNPKVHRDCTPVRWPKF
jgi:hypothetical protein